MSSTTSRPMRSARASGPIGCRIPSVMIRSMSRAAPTPSMSAKAASLIIGMRTRLETNPGASLTAQGVFPRRRARAMVVSNTGSEVSSPRMTSTSSMTGTGFMKCMPMNRSARPDRAPSRVIEIDEVFVARIVSGDSRGSSAA